MIIHQNPVSKEPRTRCNRTRNGSAQLDGIFTHCGFVEPRDPLGSTAMVARHCDDFMAGKYGRDYDFVWVASIQDYLPSAEAFEATAALAQNL